MSQYLFIQSQDPFTETRTAHQYSLATSLHEAGHQVSVVLVQNGVTPARSGSQCDVFDALLSSGLTVVADDFSLTQREITASQLKGNVTIGSIDLIVDALLDGHKVIWN